MSAGKLVRKLGRLRASNRIRAHAQRVAADAISAGRHEWLRRGASEERQRHTRVMAPPAVDPRDDYGACTRLLMPRPELERLLVPLRPELPSSFMAAPLRMEVAEFCYRPMALRCGRETIAWWDIVPVAPRRTAEHDADELERIAAELEYRNFPHLAANLMKLLPRIRLHVRETARELEK